MSSFSKRVSINQDILLEYIYDDSNFRSDDYKVLTNLKDNSKSYISKIGLNTEENSLLLIDSVNDKYSPVNLSNFNFLRLQTYPSSYILCDTVRVYFATNFDFYSDYLGYYINIFTYGYDNNTKYYLSNFFYDKSVNNPFDVFTLTADVKFNGTIFNRYVEFNIPSVYNVSHQRLVTLNGNEPTPNSINYNLTDNGDGTTPKGLSVNSPVFVEFGFITSPSTTTLGIKYYNVGDLLHITVPQVPEFDEIGVGVVESTQGDYFEIYGTYMGSNENMDEFVYNQSVRGNNIELNYIISVYEENILTNTQTIEVTENYAKKLLYRPIIQFSNTTASIDVELRIINTVDSSYVSKFGSIGITNSINKYGRTLTRLNLENNTLRTDIFNIKYKNVLGGSSSNNQSGSLSFNEFGNGTSFNNNGNGSSSNISGNGSSSSNSSNTNNPLTVVRVPYPVLMDRYNVLTKSTNSPANTKYVANGLLDIIINSFDTVINFNIAKDINSDGSTQPYDLTKFVNNSKIQLVFKSDVDKVEKDIYFEGINKYENGIICFKVEEIDYLPLKKIYDKGFDKFYIVVNSLGSTTQLYSGKYVFYEDVVFTDATDNTTNNILGMIDAATNNSSSNSTTPSVDAPTTTVDVDSAKDAIAVNNNPTTASNMTASSSGSTSEDSNYTNLILYVRYLTNQESLDAWLKDKSIVPKYSYNSMYYLERIEKVLIKTFQDLKIVEEVFIVPLTSGDAPIPK